ncbi:hypothetical protein [Leptolyngbya sp. Cla-17]
MIWGATTQVGCAKPPQAAMTFWFAATVLPVILRDSLFF